MKAVVESWEAEWKRMDMSPGAILNESNRGQIDCWELRVGLSGRCALSNQSSLIEDMDVHTPHVPRSLGILSYR